MPVIIKYDMTSDNNSINNLNGVISTILTQYMSDEYIESILMLTVENIVSKTNQTLLECIIMDLENESMIVIVNSSGNKIICLFDPAY